MIPRSFLKKNVWFVVLLGMLWTSQFFSSELNTLPECPEVHEFAYIPQELDNIISLLSNLVPRSHMSVHCKQLCALHKKGVRLIPHDIILGCIDGTIEFVKGYQHEFSDPKFYRIILSCLRSYKKLLDEKRGVIVYSSKLTKAPRETSNVLPSIPVTPAGPSDPPDTFFVPGVLGAGDLVINNRAKIFGNLTVCGLINGINFSSFVDAVTDDIQDAENALTSCCDELNVEIDFLDARVDALETDVEGRLDDLELETQSLQSQIELIENEFDIFQEEVRSEIDQLFTFTAITATNFTGTLTGDVTGTQHATQVSSVGGQTASNIAMGVQRAQNATDVNSANTLVARDASGDFSAGTITANLIGSASENVLKTGDTMTGALNLSGAGADLSVDGDLTIGGTSIFGSEISVNDLATIKELVLTGNLRLDGTATFTSGTPGVAKNILLVHQGQLYGPNEFSSINAAISTITDANPLNRYVVKVGPGIYIEDTIVLPPFVTIEGESQFSCIVQVDDPSKDAIIVSPESLLESIKVQGATDPGKACVVFQGGGIFRIFGVRFGKCDIGLNQSATLGPSLMVAEDLSGDSDADFSNLLRITSGPFFPTVSSVNNVIWQSTANPNLQEVVHISNPLTFLIFNKLNFGAALGFIGGTGLCAENGVTLQMNGSTFSGMNLGIFVPNVGAGPSLNVAGIFTRNNVQDLNIENPLCTGSLSGAFESPKIAIEDNADVSLLITDPVNRETITAGPFLGGRNVGSITNLSPQINRASTLGVLEGGDLIISGTAVHATAGNGYLMVGVAPNDDLRFVEWNQHNNLFIPVNVDCFIFVNANGLVEASLSKPDPITSILLGKARSDQIGNPLYVQNMKHEADHKSTQLDESWREALQNIYVSGSIVSKNGNTQLDVSSGEYYFSTQRYQPSGGVAISWQAFYRDGVSNFLIVPQTNIDYEHFDNGSGILAPIPLGQYTRHALYVTGQGDQEQYLMVYGTEVHPTLLAAQNGSLPNAPGLWTGNISLIASIIVRNTATVSEQISEIRDERPRLGFRAAGLSVVSDHGDLTGLLQDDHPQYVLANGTRSLSGSLNIGGNNITNVGQVDGVDVSSHAARHIPNGTDPLPTAAPVSLGSLNQEGIQNSFARSDHVHAHGNQPGGSLHAEATSGVAGFMSAADKAKLDGINSANFVQVSGDTMTGSLTLPEGTGSDPALRFVGSTNTGISAPTPENLTICTDGAERLNIASDGKVTITDLSNGVVHADLTGELSSSLIMNDDIDNAAQISDAKLATITTSGKVANEATTATEINNPDSIVLRDTSGNFTAGVITADLIGTASCATKFTGTLSGDVVGTQDATAISSVGGESVANVVNAVQAVNSATAANVPNTLMQRDGSGNVNANQIQANLVGNVTGSASGNVAKTGDTMTGGLTISGISSDLVVHGDANFGSIVTVSGPSSEFEAEGSALFEGNVKCNGPVEFCNDVNMTGTSVCIQGDVKIDGQTQLNSLTAQQAIFSDTVALNGMMNGLTVNGDANFAQNISVGDTAALNDLVISGNLLLEGTATFTTGTPGIASNVLLVHKGVLHGPNEYNSINAALASITDATPLNRYIIEIGPGVYIEDTIALKSNVILKGKSRGTTIINVNHPSKNVIEASPVAVLENLLIQGATTPGSAGLVFDGGGGLLIFNCIFGNNNTQIKQTSNNGPSFTQIQNCTLIRDGNFEVGIDLSSTLPNPSVMLMNGFIWSSVIAPPSLSDVFKISGPATNFIGNSLSFGSQFIFLGGNGFNIENGATCQLNQVTAFGFDTALNVPNVGLGPVLGVSGAFTRNNTTDIQIDNPLATGSIIGAFVFENTFIDANADISLLISDPVHGETVTAGPFLGGRNVAAITNISPQINRGSNLGVLEGGDLSVTGTMVNISAGNGYLMVGTAPDDDLKFVEWDAQTLTFPPNKDSFVFVNESGIVEQSLSSPDLRTTVFLGKVRTGNDSSEILFLQQIKQQADHQATQLDDSLRQSLGNIYVTGSLVSKNGDLQLDITSGRYFFSSHEFNPSGGSPATWCAFFRDGMGNYSFSNQTMIDFDHYDDGSGTLASIPSGEFARHALYVVGDGADEHYLFIYATETHATLLDAQNGGLPNAPSSWTGNIALIASIIVQNTVTPSNRIAEIRDERPRLGFRASGLSVVTNHGDLSGLLNDDHPQYLLANGSRAMSGNLDVGGNAISNTGLINGVDITTHASRHVPNGSDPLPTGIPSAIGSSNQEGVQNSFARSDHIHTHGNQAGGTLHADATMSVSGFMSSSDKAKLDALNSTDYVHVTGDTMTGSLTLPAGTPSDPSLRFAGSTLSGILAEQPDTLEFCTTGTTRLEISSTGTVTISNLSTGVVHANMNGELTSSLVTNNDVDPAAAIEKSKLNLTNAITNGDINASAAIEDTKLGTISTPGKVANTATSGTSANIPNTLVLRDASGNFAAGTITANVVGNATSATTATNFSGSLSGDVTGSQNLTQVATVGGQTAANVAMGTQRANNATHLNVANQLISRDGSGNFAAGTITANVVGNATSATTATNFSGSLSGDVTGNQGSTQVVQVGGETAANIATGVQRANNATNANTANTLVSRDASGNFSAGTITANLSGNATTATNATTAANFSGSLSGDVTGSQGTTQVVSVGGETAANIATGVQRANNATNANTANTLVSRDASGNFSAGTITANLSGNATTATNATTAANFSGSLSGDVTGNQNSTAVNTVGGETAANIATGVQRANNATNANTANALVSRDASGNFSAGTITANLSGNATTATTATTATNFSGSLSGDVTGIQSSTTVNTVGGETAANIATGVQRANNATNTNTANALVQRDANGDFSANEITADLIGNVTGSASNNVLKSGDTMTGSLVLSGGSNLTVDGDAVVSGCLDVTMSSTFRNDLTLLGASNRMCIQGDLKVDGESDFGNITAQQAVFNDTVALNGMMNGLTVNGNAMFSQDITVNNVANIQDLILSGDLQLEGMITFTSGTPAIPKNMLLVHKGQLHGPNEFSSVNAAIATITDASFDNRYVVKVGPGVFVEDTVVVPPFVTIEGESQFSCVIEVDDPSKDAVIVSPESLLESIKIQGATDPGKACVLFQGGGILRLFGVRFGKCDIGLHQVATLGPSLMVAEDLSADADADFSNMLRITSGPTFPVIDSINNVIWQSNANPNLTDIVHVSNPFTFLIFNKFNFGSALAFINGTGICMENGATMQLNGATFSGLTRGIHVPNVGLGASLHIAGGFTRNNIEDIRIDSPLATGSVSAAFESPKIFIDSSADVSLLINDPVNRETITAGPLLSGRNIASITNISPQINRGSSLGVLEGGDLSSTGTSVDISAGNGYLMVGIAPDNDLKYVEWSAQNINVPAISDTYIFVNESGIVEQSPSQPDPLTKIFLGKAQTDIANNVLFLQQIKQEADHQPTQLDNSLRESLGNIYVSGSLVSKNGDLQLDITSGRYFYSSHEFTPVGGSPVSWCGFFRDGMGNYSFSNQTMIDFDHYDDGTGTLATIPSGEFARHALYVVGDGSDEHYLLVYATETHASLLDAQNGGLPNAPSSWTGNIALIASIIVENTAVASNRIAEIRDERPRLGFRASGLSVVTDHGDLSGLGNDDHPQYMLANGTRTMTGGLNMGGNAISNVGLVDGVDISSHAVRHLPNGTDPLTTASPVTVGTSNQEGVQNSFARSDHVHAHGNQAGGLLHADATTMASGFMSASDKVKLDALDPALNVQKSGDTMTGALQLPIGTAGSPSLQFTGNTTTGLFVINPNTLGLSTNGLSRFEIDQSGQVTIPNLTSGVVHANGSGDLTASLITDADISNSANISDIKLGTIATSGKVANSATTATSNNTGQTIVARDLSGNFSAGTITANLSGNAATANTATNFSGSLAGDVTGLQSSTSIALVGGETAANVAMATQRANAAVSINTPNTLVLRDGTGNFSAGTITANLVGNATTANDFTGTLAGDVTGNQSTTSVSMVGGQTAANIATGVQLANNATNLNTANSIVRRNASGDFTAGTITANLSGNATSATTATTATNFTGSLAGDVSGNQNSTVVTNVGGQTAANVATGVTRANNGTNTNVPNTLVARDGSGNFTAGTITANLSGNATSATTATTATNFSGSLTGDVIGTQGATQVSLVGGQTAANVAAGTQLANNATSVNTANTIVRRNASGNFTAGTITADLVGNASTATTATNFSGSLSGDVIGTQGATVVASVGGESAADIANVVNNMTNATSSNTPDTLVLRDISGNFSAGTITANLTGNASGNVLKTGDTMTGTLVLPTGAVASPSLTFSGSATTGVSVPSVNTLTLSTAGQDRLTIDPLGNTTYTCNYKAHVYLSADSTTGVAQRIVDFDTVTFDPNSNYNNLTGEYTAPVTGYYLVHAQVNIIPSGGSDRQLFILVNGATRSGYSVRIQCRGGRDCPLALNQLIQLNQGDTLQIRLDGNTSDLMQANHSSMSIHLMSR